VHQCRYGHLLCGGCLDELRSRAGEHPPKCPTCRTELPDELNRNLAAEHSIALLPATCRHCTGKTTRGALGLHEKTCPSNPEVVQQGKNKALLLAVAHDSLATFAGRLIAGGAEVDAVRPGDGFTPLIVACFHGNVAMVARLIAAWGGVNIASTAGSTPLFLAAAENRLDVLKLLIAAGADVNKACRWLHSAARGSAKRSRGRRVGARREFRRGCECGYDRWRVCWHHAIVLRSAGQSIGCYEAAPRRGG
jgi:hypothetical protein